MTTAGQVRGHRFLPPIDVLSRIPGLYGTEDVPARDKTIWVHYFVGGSDWYVAELSSDHRLAFGFVRLNADAQNAEWSYISIPELRDLLVAPAGYPIVVERDLNWTPKAFREIRL